MSLPPRYPSSTNNSSSSPTKTNSSKYQLKENEMAQGTEKASLVESIPSPLKDNTELAESIRLLEEMQVRVKKIESMIENCFTIEKNIIESPAAFQPTLPSNHMPILMCLNAVFIFSSLTLLSSDSFLLKHENSVTDSYLSSIGLTVVFIAIIALFAYTRNESMQLKSISGSYNAVLQKHEKELENALDAIMSIEKMLQKRHNPSTVDSVEADKNTLVIFDGLSASSSSSIGETQSKEKSTSNDISTEIKDDDIFIPKPGYRLNWMADSGVPFEPQLEVLTEKQRNNFYKFRDAFLKRFNENKEIDRNKFYQVPDDYTMLRFLKADDFNVDLASNRLIGACIWRQKSGFDDFITKPHRKAFKFFLAVKSKHALGVDKSEKPFVIEKLGQFLSNEHIIPIMPLQLWTMCYAYDVTLGFQEFRDVSIKYNRVIHEVDLVSDLAGIKFFSTMKMLSVLKAMTKDVEMNFPEVVGIVSLVNPPGIIGALWAVGKRFIDAKVSFLFYY